MLNIKEQGREAVVSSGPDYSFIPDPGLCRVMESVEKRVISRMNEGRMKTNQLIGNQAFLKILHTNSAETRAVLKEAVDWGVIVPLVETVRSRDGIRVSRYFDCEKLRRFTLYCETRNRLKQHTSGTVWPHLIVQAARLTIGVNPPLEELRF